jgi:hypothetical protein
MRNHDVLTRNARSQLYLFFNLVYRKEARRRELKKNKKQRILVRTAVLKGLVLTSKKNHNEKYRVSVGIASLLGLTVYREESKRNYRGDGED